jgi:hypothetical protein
MTLQLADYVAVGHALRSMRSDGNEPARTALDALGVAQALLNAVGEISYFALHKLFYLIEYTAFKRRGSRLTTAYFIRQQDGPYCTNLSIARLKKRMPRLRVRNAGGRLLLRLDPSQIPMSVPLFAESHSLDKELDELIGEVLGKYRTYDDSQLKTAAYLSKPMRLILREEAKVGKLLNQSIQFEVVRAHA